MSKLMKGQVETYNPQIHTEALSLGVQAEKSPAVHKATIDRFAKYAKFTSLLYLSGRVNGGLKNQRITRDSVTRTIADNAYRVKYEGMEVLPLISMGAVVVGAFHATDDMTSVSGVTYAAGSGISTAEDVVTDTLGSFAAKHEPDNNIYGDKLNPHDKIGLGHGLDKVEFIVINKRRASTNDHYIYDGKFIVGGLFQEESFAEDEVLMETGNIVGEGSTTGFQRDGRNYWEIFFSHKSRYTLRFTGDALRQRRCRWVHPTEKNPNSKTKGAYWEFEEEERADRIFAMMNELSLRYNVSTMDMSAGHKWFENAGRNLLTGSHFAPTSGITPPASGDGFITSILDTLDLTYDPNDKLDYRDLQTTLNVLAENSPIGNSGNLFICLGDKIARQAFNETMMFLIGLNVGNGGTTSGQLATNVIVDMNNVPTKLGFEITEYEYLGNKVIFVEDSLLSHPGLMGKNGGLTGYGDMFFINITPMDDGTSMFELMAGERGRFFIKKYVDGLHSLHPQGEASMFASSGFDGAVAHYFTELMPVNYFSNCSAVIRASRKYTGRISPANEGNIDFSKFPYMGPAAGQL